MVAALYLVSTWAAVSGYLHWKGVTAGTARLAMRLRGPAIARLGHVDADDEPAPVPLTATGTEVAA